MDGASRAQIAAATLLMVAAATCSTHFSTLGTQAHLHSHAHRLRDFSRLASLEPGAPVEAAAKLYSQLVERGRAMRGIAGLQIGAAAAHSCSPALGPLLGAAAGASTRSHGNQTAVINPVDFGADPTGQSDSSDAMSAAMNAIAKLCEMQSGHLSFNVTCDATISSHN